MKRQLVLQALRGKYEQLLALHDAVPERSPARRKAMDEVARRFPGALREWQALPPAELQARLDAVRSWLSGNPDSVALPDWVLYGAALHAWLRWLLALRKYALSHGAGASDADWLAAAQDLAAEINEPSLLAYLTPALRAQVARPPLGQLSRLAYAAVAAQFGVSEADVKAALFGETRDRPRSA